MARKKTHEEFVEEVKALVGDEYTVVSTYVNTETKLDVIHKECNHKYAVRPKVFLSGCRCPICAPLKIAEKTKKSHAEFLHEIYKKFGGAIELRSSYVNNNTKVEVFCTMCDSSYKVLPRILLFGKDCSSCSKIKTTANILRININSTKRHEVFTREVKNLGLGEYYVEGEYVNAKTHIDIRHRKCGSVYSVQPTSFLGGKRCPVCKESKGEHKISQHLISSGFKFERQEPIRYESGKMPLYLDFYVQGVAIEYDGEYHYKPMPHAGGEDGLRDQQRRDHIKDKYCADNGIPLIRIPYWDFDNIDAILTEKLLPLLKEYAA